MSARKPPLKDDGRQAFARPFSRASESGEAYWEQNGLTRREYAAIHIAAGLVSDASEGYRPDDLANDAVKLTDALLYELDLTAREDRGTK